MNLELELNLFSNFIGKESEHLQISSPGPSILHIKNKSLNSNPTLGFLALVHGNEYVGLPIINSLIQSLLSGEVELKSDVYFGLGNVPASFANQRFIDEDLNRSFG